MDRRAMRTRQALFDAVIALVQRVPFDQLTVEDIVAEANVGRTTFYAHFTSKTDLIERCLDRLRDELVAAAEQSAASGQPVPISLVLFRHIEAYREVRGALMAGRASAVLQQAVDQALAAALRRILPGETGSDLSRELAIRAIVAQVNVVLLWAGERELTAEAADSLFRRLLPAGLPPAFVTPLLD